MCGGRSLSGKFQSTTAFNDELTPGVLDVPPLYGGVGPIRQITVPVPAEQDG